MTSVQDNNSQEVLNQTYSSKDFAKDAISLQSASVEEIVEYASKNFDLDTNQIDSLRGTIGEIKTNVISGVLAWDTSKSTGENIAYVIGPLVQDYGEGLIVGMVTTAPEAYQSMVQSEVFPQNTIQWNAHINELIKDLYSRKAENLKSTINYENIKIID